MRPLFTALLLFTCAGATFAKPTPPANTARVNQLVAVLKSDASQKDKADACRELARIGTKDAVAPLAALLPDEKLSHMARYGLETIPVPAADKALRAAATKLQGRLLVGVIGSIGVRRDPKAVKALAKLLHSSDNDVAQAAARALGSIGNRPAANALLDALNAVSAPNQLAFCEGLLRCAETAAARGDSKAACTIYDRLRETAAPQQVRAAALRGAILTRQDGGLPLLSQAFHNDDLTLALTAARTAQEMPGTPVTHLLATELPTLPADRQVLLIQVLARRADPEALPALLVATRNAEKPARLAAIRAVAELGNPSAFPVLLELLADPDKDVAAAAQESLAGLPGKEVDAAIIKLLSDGPAPRRLTAMALVVRRRITSAIPALFDAAGGSDPTRRTAAVRTLGELAGPDELPRLLGLLARSPSPEDLEAAEQALSTVSLKAPDPGSCVGQLEARLAQAPPAQKCALIRVLAAVGGANALKAVRSAVSDPNSEVHAAAIRALAGWNTADAAPDLLELAKAAVNPTDKMICLRGYLRLARQSELGMDKRLAMCRQAAGLAQQVDEKKLLLAALGAIASIEALDLITPYLDEAGTKEEAATAAVDVADKLLKEKDAAKVASRLAEVLDKVAGATASADRAKRAKELRDQAETKAREGERPRKP